MDPRDLIPALERAVARLEAVAPYASAYARRNAGTVVRVDGVSASAEPLPQRAGFTLSAWTGARFLEASVDRLAADAVEAAAERLCSRLAGLRGEAGGPALAPGDPLRRHFAQAQGEDSRAVPVAAKVALARALRERLRSGTPRLVEAMGMVGDTHAEIVFVNRARALSQELHRVRQIGVGIFAADGHQAQLHAGFERIGGWEHMHLGHPYLETIRADGPRILGAPRIPDPGEHDCVFSGDFAGIFAHEAFGHGTEQDMFLKDRAKGAEYLGKPVASPLVSMYDDPANGWAASYFFDDEGVLAAPTRIIEDGVLVAGINDAYSATLLNQRGLGVAKTANGRREAFDHKAYTRMTNTFFGAGTSSLPEMILATERGYLLRHPSNGMEDPKGWGIQLEGACAEEIRDGALTGRVFSPVVVTGSVPRLLRSITLVGNEVEEASLGMCGKGYKEWVKVTDGGPPLKLRATVA